MNKITIVCSAFIISLSGCASQLAFHPEKAAYVKNKDNLIYMGSRECVGLLNSHGHDAGLGLFAFPASFVADTVLLPWSVPKTAMNSSASQRSE